MGLLLSWLLSFANFSDHCNMGKTSAVSSNRSDHVAYNWMAPEIMNQCPPSFASDMYSYCCVVWEMLKCKSQISWCSYFFFFVQFLLYKRENALAVKLWICSQLLFHSYWLFVNFALCFIVYCLFGISHLTWILFINLVQIHVCTYMKNISKYLYSAKFNCSKVFLKFW